MAVGGSILCVVGNDEEAGQFKDALASLSIANPVYCMHDANAALDDLEQRTGRKEPTPILVFLSLTAPEANRLAAWFESHPRERPPGLIAMTGFTDMRPIIQAYHLGVTSFLEWPLKKEDVRNALQSNPDLRLDHSEGTLVIRPNVDKSKRCDN